MVATKVHVATSRGRRGDARTSSPARERLSFGFGSPRRARPRRFPHAYGGNSYDYIMTAGLEMLRRAGIGEAQIASMLVDNPRRALAFPLDS